MYFILMAYLNLDLNAQQPHSASGYRPAAVQVDRHPVHNHISKYSNRKGNKCYSEGGNSAQSALGKSSRMLQEDLRGELELARNERR